MSNPDDVFEGSHAEFAFNESYVSPGEKAWLAWIAAAEKIYGRSIDGDEGDGISIDAGLAAFKAGETPEWFIANAEGDPPEPSEDGMSDVEADADTLRMAGFGTDEDYGGPGDERL